ncbi:FIST C-terminal domain-containing protein [Xanthobacter dioxanivorans]|uniref:FIST C-terminal domain-containing protein n=1 Tax=Xanthobacter dioxanivorans TaxID=2528964 RepID=A0A974SJ61_9HYPH|nr:FIST N-terminal domain-containing protein [Xanthobacter dioxanivorans]QRG06053.1 FIST C-terminal domain-containing protein [Xanthobacter dioxanivorans]
MSKFIQAHAGDANWQIALGSCWAQVRHQLQEASKPSLGWCYLTDHYTAAAGNIMDALRERMPEVHWVGTVGVGVAAEATEYFDAPGMVLMLADLPEGSFRLFSSPSPLDAGGFEAFTALVHADGASPDLPDQLKALSEKTTTGYLFGGLSSARNQPLLFADEVLLGGVSGVAFGPEVPVLSRVTQGCQPIGPQRTITRAEGNYLVSLDDHRALDCVLEDLGLGEEIPDPELRHALAQTLAGLSTPGEDVSAKPGRFGANTEVRHLLGVGRTAGVLVVAEQIKAGMQLAFCTRNAEAARSDLLRIVSEVRIQAEAAGGIRGALYISCSGRGGPHFGKANAEFQMVSAGLGPVPLVGFFAGGEIARHHLYGYTGVLTVFTEAA